MKVKYNGIMCILFLSIIPIMIFSIYFHYNFMEEKAFVTPNKVLMIMNNFNSVGPTTGEIFVKCAKLYDKINILKLNTVKQWSIAINLVFNPIIMFFLLKFKKIDWEELFFIIVNFFLLDVFAYNLGKEPIQLFVFLIVYTIVKSKLSSTKKIVFSSVVFAIEAALFREYYIIVAGLTILIYLLLYRFKLESKEKRKSVLLILAIIIAFFSSAMFCMKYISPSNYSELINRRDYSERYLGDFTATLIGDVFPNTNHWMYTLNYIINLVRIFIPIELVFKGIKYVPFVIYQLYITYYIMKNVKKVNKNNIVNITIILAYFLCSATFEPDFGSLIRHESILVLFFVQMIKDVKNKEEIDEKSVSD